MINVSCETLILIAVLSATREERKKIMRNGVFITTENSSGFNLLNTEELEGVILDIHEKEQELIKAGYELHHAASRAGYVHRTKDGNTGIVCRYNGKFGTGYTIHYESQYTRSHVVAYYVK